MFLTSKYVNNGVKYSCCMKGLECYKKTQKKPQNANDRLMALSISSSLINLKCK